jgi:two-component system catabolic regulation response regulator CreB/two-component system response regulator ChvI
MIYDNENDIHNSSNNKNNYNNRILIVDDEVDITTVFTLGLEDNGFKVEAFNDAIQALASFKSGLYDLVLIDYKMPRMNGFELYQEIRKIDDKVKICIITAFDLYHEDIKKKFRRSSNKSQQDKIVENGVGGELNLGCIIQKPIEIDDLVKRVKEELNS